MLIGRRQIITDILKFPHTFLENQPKASDTQYDKLTQCAACGERSKWDNIQEVYFQNCLTSILFSLTVYHYGTIKQLFMGSM